MCERRKAFCLAPFVYTINCDNIYGFENVWYNYYYIKEWSESGIWTKE